VNSHARSRGSCCYPPSSAIHINPGSGFDHCVRRRQRSPSARRETCPSRRTASGVCSRRRGCTFVTVRSQHEPTLGRVVDGFGRGSNCPRRPGRCSRMRSRMRRETSHRSDPLSGAVSGRPLPRVRAISRRAGMATWYCFLDVPARPAGRALTVNDSRPLTRRTNSSHAFHREARAGARRRSRPVSVYDQGFDAHHPFSSWNSSRATLPRAPAQRARCPPALSRRRLLGGGAHSGLAWPHRPPVWCHRDVKQENVFDLRRRATSRKIPTSSVRAVADGKNTSTSVIS